MKLHHQVYCLNTWVKVVFRVGGEGIGSYALAMEGGELRRFNSVGGGYFLGYQTETSLPTRDMRNWDLSERMNSKSEIYHFSGVNISSING